MKSENEGFATSNGKKLHYKWLNKELLGQAEAVIIFLHDGLGSIGQWKDFPQVLCDELQLSALIYDRYGHGQSEGLAEKRKPGYLHDEALKFLPGLLEQLDITQPIILLGHSDGGAIALLYASHFPERVKAVITEAGHVFVEEEMRAGIRQAVEVSKKGKLKPLLEKYHGENTETVFYGWADIWLSDEFFSWNIEDDLPGITAPVLTIQGEGDEYGHLRQPKPIAEKVSGPSRELWVKDCGHIPHHQQRELVVGEIVSFVKSI